MFGRRMERQHAVHIFRTLWLAGQRLFLGTMKFELVTHEALQAGINSIDTADVYGGPQSPEMEKATASLRR